MTVVMSMPCSWVDNPSVLFSIHKLADVLPFLDSGSLSGSEYINSLTRFVMLAGSVAGFTMKSDYRNQVIIPTLASVGLLAVLSRRRCAIDSSEPNAPSGSDKQVVRDDTIVAASDQSPGRLGGAERFLSSGSRETTGRSFVGATLEEQIYSNRPTSSLDEMRETGGESYWQNGRVGIFKTMLKIV